MPDPVAKAMTTEELADEFDAHAKDAMDQYNATDWNSKSKRAGMIAKAQTWQKAAILVRNAANAEIERLKNHDLVVTRIDLREVYMTDAYKAAIEAMARAASDAQLGAGVWKSFSESLHNDWLKSAEAHYTTLLEHLAATGWQVVPAVATERMLDAGGKNANVQTDRGPGGSGGIYADMLAAAPKFGGAE